MTVVAAGQVRVQRADVEANVGRCLPRDRAGRCRERGAPRSPRVRVDRLYVRLGGSGSRRACSVRRRLPRNAGRGRRAPPGDHGGRLPGSNPVRIPQLGRSARRRRPDRGRAQDASPGSRRRSVRRPGARIGPVVDTPFGKLGVAICYDFRFPEVCRSLALAGAEVIAVPVNWSTAVDGAGRALRAGARGREPRVRRGRRPRRRGDGASSSSGASQIVAPCGTRLTRCDNREQDVELAVATRRSRQAARRKSTVFEPRRSRSTSSPTAVPSSTDRLTHSDRSSNPTMREATHAVEVEHDVEDHDARRRGPARRHLPPRRHRTGRRRSSSARRTAGRRSRASTRWASCSAERGYRFVLQAVRGTDGSGGAADLLRRARRRPRHRRLDHHAAVVERAARHVRIELHGLHAVGAGVDRAVVPPGDGHLAVVDALELVPRRRGSRSS